MQGDICTIGIVLSAESRREKCLLLALLRPNQGSSIYSVLGQQADLPGIMSAKCGKAEVILYQQKTPQTLIIYTL